MGHDESEKCPVCGTMVEELDRKIAALEREVKRYQALHAAESDY